MSPFRGGSVGGLNIDRDIKDMIKVRDPKPIDPAAVEVLAVRTAVISAFAEQSPDEKARAKPNNLRTWEKWSRDSVEASKQLVEEAAKGKSADEKKLKTLLTTLNARCTDCHNTGDRGD
jgi:cytochrome c556